MADIYSSTTAPTIKGMEQVLNRRRLYELLRTQLENERTSFMSHWRELAENVLPRRIQLNTLDTNRGNKRNSKIIDSTGTLAARTLRAGMLSGITSPARPWFHLTTKDKKLDEVGRVKTWLYEVANLMSDVFLGTNLYSCLPVVYGDMGLFGTAAMLIEEDFKDVLRFYVFPIGSYCIANDATLKVRVFERQFRMSVRAVVERFCARLPSGEVDFSNVSTVVKTLYLNGNGEAWIDIIHFIVPNKDFDPSKVLSKYKKYISIYYEFGATSLSSTNYVSPADEGKFLSEKGYDYFPVLAPRWETVGQDIYGTDCPGMTCLGDLKQLQSGEKKSLQAVEKMVQPPMVGPSALKTTKVSILPGELTYSDEREGQKGFRPAHEVNFPIDKLEMKQDQCRSRIKRAWFEDLFLMLYEDERQQPATATEIVERKEEKLIALGPVLTSFNQEFLDPLIDISFMILQRQGRIPKAPDELRGRNIQPEYVSILAQAMKLAGLSGIDRFSAFVGNLATTTQDPTVLDKVNKDKLIDVYGDLTSVPPGIINDDDQVAQIRGARAQQQQQQAKMEQLAAGAKAAKDLSGARTDEPNALNDLIQQAKAGQIAPQ